MESIVNMVATVLIVALLVLFAECNNPARADVATIDRAQWTPRAQVWTARAAVAEVGWTDGRGKIWTDERRRTKRDEQLAVWYVLRARWSQLSKRWPDMRFVDVLRAYCAGLSDRREPTPRQLWIRALPLDGTEPAHWPRRIRWDNHRRLWTDTLDRADLWAHGRAGVNPCPGATHFGGLRAGDLPRGRMKRHPCSTRFEAYRGSTFYRVVD